MEAFITESMCCLEVHDNNSSLYTLNKRRNSDWIKSHSNLLINEIIYCTSASFIILRTVLGLKHLLCKYIRTAALTTQAQFHTLAMFASKVVKNWNIA